MYGYYYDSTILIILPFFLLSIWASSRVQKVFNKYAKVRVDTNLTGADAARRMLEMNGVDVRIEQSRKRGLSDHYDPKAKVIRLSDEVYAGNSVSSVSVACHEVGHAIQHARGYKALAIRNSIFPAVNLSSRLWFIIFLIGIFASIPQLTYAGIALFGVVVLFQVITLPVEFDASARAIKNMREIGIVGSDQLDGAKKVLRAAALTYVAATLASIANLVRLLILSGRRD